MRIGSPEPWPLGLVVEALERVEERQRRRKERLRERKVAPGLSIVEVGRMVAQSGLGRSWEFQGGKVTPK